MATPQFPRTQIAEKTTRKEYIRYLFKRIFVDDWFLKLVALGITLTLWIVVSGLQTTDRVRLPRVTLSARIPDQFEITNAIAQEVEIQVVGEKRKLDRIIPQNLVVAVDLSGISEGERTVRLTPENVSVDLEPGIRVERITPDRIVIKVERVIERELPIKPDIEGKPPAGYEVYNSTVTPAKVTVRGPRSFVDPLNSVGLEPVSVSMRTADFSAMKVPLKTVNSKVTFEEIVAADIFIRIGKRRVERLFIVPYDTGTRTGRASVLLYGPSKIIEELSTEEIEIVEVNEDNRSELEVRLPSGFDDVVDIKSVKYRE